MADSETNIVDNRRFNSTLIVSCVVVVTTAAIFLYFQNLSYNKPCDFGPLFGTASLIILLGMFGLYQYAYSFYKDIFYQLLSVGWLLNAIYIYFETFFEPGQRDLNYDIEVYLLGLVTLIPFHVARFTKSEGQLDYPRLLRSTVRWGIFILLFSALCFWLVANPLRNIGMNKKFAIIAASGIPFAIWCLRGVGNNLRVRLDPDIHKKFANIFPRTFYIYAWMQPLYLAKLILGESGLMHYVFLAALLPKIANSIAALAVIRLDISKFQQLLEQRSVLEDIGALTASIEHDIKNPLQVIESELESMRSRYQSSEEVTSFINRLDEQRRRIYATTQVIPVIRGGKEYYEQFMEKTNIKDLINRSIKAVRKELNTNNIIFKVEDRDLFVKAYRPMLEQAVVNILRNAVEAIRECRRQNGHVSVSIKTVEKLDNNKVVRVDFEDNGCGISEEILPDITSLFMSTRRKSKPNSGIGLFITKRILKVHNGRLEFRNGDKDGAVFSILLPQWGSRGRA